MAADLIDFRDRGEDSHEKYGFRYVSFFFEGEDILFLCRTAVNGAASFHDSNSLTFHRIKNFRSDKPTLV